MEYNHKFMVLVVASLMLSIGAFALFDTEDQTGGTISDNTLSAVDIMPITPLPFDLGGIVPTAIPVGAIPVTNSADIERIGTGVTYGGFTWSLSAYYYLTQNITLSGTNNHTAIGTSSAPFVGTLDGNGFHISGLNMSGGALIGYLVNGEIKNLGMINSIGVSSGIIMYATESVITNCYNTSNITGNSGITGSANLCTITNCYNTGNITGNTVAAGIVGSTTSYPGSIVSYCYNTGTITAGSSSTSSSVYASGIMAYCRYSSGVAVTNCYNTGDVSATAGTSSVQAAGIVTGDDNNVLTIKNCYNTGNITTVSSSTSQHSQRAGGIASHAIGPIVNCYSTGNVSVSSSGGQIAHAGGIAGDTRNTIVNCYFISGTISKGGSVVSDVLFGNSPVYPITAVTDGISTPPRLTTPNQSSGAKSASDMKPTLIAAQSNASIYYTGTTVTTIDNGVSAQPTTETGWDFFNVWDITSGSYPQLRPFAEEPEINFVSMPPETAFMGNEWSYTPETDVLGASFSVSGASWLSVIGDTISGTPNAAGTYTVKITASKSGYTDGSQTFTITVDNTLEITSTPINSGQEGISWSYTPQANAPGVTLSISPTTWLSVITNQVTGTPPAPSNGVSETFNFTLTAAKTGFISATQLISITVTAASTPSTPAVPNLVITPLGDRTFVIDASASSNFNSISIDFGDGNVANGILKNDNYRYAQSGIYTVKVTVSNSLGPVSTTKTLVAFNDETLTVAYFNTEYQYVIPVTLGGNTPTFIGPLWLSITGYGTDPITGTDYVIVSGKFTSNVELPVTVPVSLTIGSQIKEWSITVYGGSSYPTPGFGVEVSGLTVTVTPIPNNNATSISYTFFNGQTPPIYSTSTVSWPYSAPGTYTITQTVSRTVDGVPVTLQFSRVVTVSESGGNNGNNGNGGNGGEGIDWSKAISELLNNRLFVIMLLLLIITAIALIVPVARRWPVVIAFIVWFVAVLYMITRVIK